MSRDIVLLGRRLGFAAVTCEPLRSTTDAETWLCSDGAHRVILKRYIAPASGLTPSQRCRKSELAAAEFRAAGLPTPRVLGAQADEQEAAALFEDVSGRPWDSESRRRAAAVLRRLHDLPQSALSTELISLLLATEPNRERVQIGLRQLVATLDERETAWRREAPQLFADVDDLVGSLEPAASADEVRIIHGDYFAANLLPDNDTVQIIDWDLAGLGDPAWDLAFLLGAERGIPATERDAVLAEYGPLAAETARRLRWHIRSWDAFWALQARTGDGA